MTLRTPWLALPVFWFALTPYACSSARYGGDGPAPGVTFPAHFSAAEKGEPDAGPGNSGPAARPSPSARVRRRAGHPPDPPALRTSRQWEYELVYDRGTVRVARVTERRFAKPVATARRIGRYAIELWIGQELIDRVRFDFPLLAAENVRSERRRPLHEPPTFAPGAVVSQTVAVPASPRARRAVILDRATGWTQRLPWPPAAVPAADRRNRVRAKPRDGSAQAGPDANGRPKRDAEHGGDAGPERNAEHTADAGVAPH